MDAWYSLTEPCGADTKDALFLFSFLTFVSSVSFVSFVLAPQGLEIPRVYNQ